MDDELADLIPLFLGEARERLARLYELLPQMGQSPPALLAARRELHTIEGSSRMLGFAAMATLCREGQTLLAEEASIPTEQVAGLLDRVREALAAVAPASSPEHAS